MGRLCRVGWELVEWALAVSERALGADHPVNIVALSAPKQIEDLLNRYFDQVTAAAFAHGGTVDKFIGDAVMIIFGAPQSTGERDQVLRCVHTAVEIQRRLRAIDLEARIGIGTGEATVGSFGSAQRTEFTAIGTPVNRAARLEPLAPPGEVLIDERTRELLDDTFSVEPFGEVQLKGFSKPVQAYLVERSDLHTARA